MNGGFETIILQDGYVTKKWRNAELRSSRAQRPLGNLWREQNGTRAMNSSSEWKQSYELKGGKILLRKSQNFISKQLVETQQTLENIQVVAAI